MNKNHLTKTISGSTTLTVAKVNELWQSMTENTLSSHWTFTAHYGVSAMGETYYVGKAKKKYPCKKNKGKHTWAILHFRNHFSYSRKGKFGGTIYGSWRPGEDQPIPQCEMAVSSWVEWRCTACTKHKKELLTTNEKHSLFTKGYDKKLDPFRQTYL